jgi:hypothetical protein
MKKKKKRKKPIKRKKNITKDLHEEEKSSMLSQVLTIAFVIIYLILLYKYPAAGYDKFLGMPRAWINP